MLTQQYSGAGEKLDFSALVLHYIQAIGNQVLQLPNEVLDGTHDKIIGRTYPQILQSYMDSIDHLEALLSPYHTEEYKKQIIEIDKNQDKLKNRMLKFSALVNVCKYHGLLLNRKKRGLPAGEMSDEEGDHEDI